MGSPYSYGEIRGGILENSSNYIEENSYKNRKNYGYEFYYNQSKLFGYLNEDIINENLLMDFKYLNDLGYFSLKEKNSENKDPLIKSKLNYYMTSDEDYLGLYARYYLDTRKLNGDYPYKNRDTTLELPTLHYHKFKTPLFLPNLIYSTDLKIHNYTRELGVNVRQYEFDFPLSYNFLLFKDYLNLELKTLFIQLELSILTTTNTKISCIEKERKVMHINILVSLLAAILQSHIGAFITHFR